MDMQVELQRLIECETKTTESVIKLATQVEKLVSAFPAGDMDGHRRYHEMMIEELQERRRLRQAIKEKTVAGLIWALIVWLGLASWDYLQGLLHMGRP